MSQHLKLYMALLGCKPEGRFTEQHDVFFGIGYTFKEMVPYMKQSWPEAKGNIHIDAWREVRYVENYKIHIQSVKDVYVSQPILPELKLFFMNLGGYKKGEFEEYHYKMLVVAEDSSAAVKKAKQEAFYKHTGFKGAASHIDDRYGLDVDDLYNIEDILSPVFKEQYKIFLSDDSNSLKEQDVFHLGYLPHWKIKD